MAMSWQHEISDGRRARRVLALAALTWWLALAGVALAARPAKGGPATPAAEALPATPEVMFRARVVKLTPAQPARIHWRWGGEGLGGDPVRGELTEYKPEAPTIKGSSKLTGDGDDGEGVTLEGDEHPTDRTIVPGDTFNYHYLNPGTWSRWSSTTTFKRGGHSIITFTLEGLKAQGGGTKDCELEFEFAAAGKSLKTFKIEGSDGPTFGLVVPLQLLGKDRTATPEFVAQVGSLRDYVQRKVDALTAMPWAAQPVPQRFAIATDCGGYGAGAGYGIRTADRATMMAEYQVLRLMGVNTLRGSSEFMNDMIRKREGMGAEFARARLGGTGGYPIPMIHYADGRPPDVHPGDGCPFHPDNVKAMQARVNEVVQRNLADGRASPVLENWALTVDEIGTVFDGTPEGKAHQGSCPECRVAFREFVQKDGRKLEDFGAPSWDDVRSTYGYWGRSYWEIKKEREEALAKARADQQTTMHNEIKENAGKMLTPGADAIDDEVAEAIEGKKQDPAAAVLEADRQMQELIWNHTAGQRSPTGMQHRLSPEGWHLLGYYSARFNNEGAAGCFKLLQETYAAENEKHRQALARGEKDTPAALQPYVYSYALRGNTFLMGGHSLDFFDFYRLADNAMVYETSNRDARVWQWDSYLCDVGRSLKLNMGKQFGIYVKPHRGAPVKRTLTAAARGGTMIYWYTYGPEWKKGDTFGGQIETLKKLAWTSRLLAVAEDVVYDAQWATPPAVAVVRGRTSEIFSGGASYENAKWVYTALMHAHIPVDALDEGLLLSLDLAKYKVIVISGSHIRRDVALKLKDWVSAGGTLYTSGWGLAKDESGRALDMLWPVFGVKARGEFERWGDVPGYGATSLGAVRQTKPPPAGAKLTAKAPLAGSFVPVVGREVLQPEAGADVVATYADGGAGALRNHFGKGTAWLMGVYSGVEYAWETMNRKPFDDAKRSLVAAPVLAAGVRPAVDADVPLVECVMLKQRQGGRLGIVVINWQFTIDRPVTFTVRGAGDAKSARSVAAVANFPLTPAGDGAVQFTLPRLDEGDVVLLE